MAYSAGLSRRLIHDTYFRLADRRPKTFNDFVESLWRYLSPQHHDGMVEFSISFRAVEMQRSVNDKEFDVLMHMVFQNVQAYSTYRSADKHNEWIDLYGALSIDRRVYDSYELPQQKGSE